MAWSDAGTQLVVWSAVLWVLAAAAVALRLFSRGRILHVLGPTDWFICVTLALSLVNTVAMGFMVDAGLGQPFSSLSPDDAVDFFKVLYGTIIASNFSVSVTKMSVLLLFLDVFIVSWLRRATYALMVFTILVGLWLTLSNIFFCVPIHQFWHFANLMDPHHHCFAFPSKYYIDGSLNLAVDIGLLFLPLPRIWQMTLPPRQKAWLYSLFGLGFLVLLISVARIAVLSMCLTSDDPTATGVYVVIWATLEINIPIVIACIPTLKPLAAKLWPRLVATPSNSEMDDLAGGARPPTISSPIRRPSWYDLDHL